MEDAMIALAIGLIPVATAGCLSPGLLMRLLDAGHRGSNADVANWGDASIWSLRNDTRHLNVQSSRGLLSVGGANGSSQSERADVKSGPSRVVKSSQRPADTSDRTFIVSDLPRSTVKALDGFETLYCTMGMKLVPGCTVAVFGHRGHRITVTKLLTEKPTAPNF